MNKSWVGVVLMLTACAVGPDYEKPVVATAEHWPGDAPGNPTAVAVSWWDAFNDPLLSALVQEGLSHNADVYVAAARVAEARGLLGVSEANLYPELDVQGAAGRTGASKNASLVRTSKPYNDFSLSGVLTFEIDLWGRLRRAEESARAELLSVQANRDAIRLAVASDIASGYFNILALDAQIRVTQNTIISREENYRYQGAQYQYGAANGLEYKQSEAELASAKAELPVLMQARQEQETALAVLLGRSPKEIVEEKIQTAEAIDALPVPPAIPADLPSSLIERRPDIFAAEQQLAANNANIGVAIAEYFPRVSLTGLLGVDSSQQSSLFERSSRMWQFGADIAGPLVDFGRVSGNVDAARARKDQAFETYQQTIRVAFKQVLDAMSAQQTAAERMKQQQIQVDARTEALRLANLRYQAGYVDYLVALDAERSLFQAQLDRITAKRDALSAALNLYKALGGGWKMDATATPEPALPTP